MGKKRGKRISKNKKWRKIGVDAENEEFGAKSIPSSSLFFEQKKRQKVPATVEERKKRARETPTATEKVVEKKRKIVIKPDPPQRTGHKKSKQHLSQNNAKRKPTLSLDLWDSDQEQEEEEDDEIAKLTKKEIRKFDYKAPEKSATKSAVPIPTAGLSYKPDFEAHQNVLGVALATTLINEEKIRLIKEKIPKSKGSALPIDMIQTGENDEEETDEEEEPDKPLDVKIPRRKTKKERRIMKEKKQRKKKLKAEEKESQFEKRLLKLDQIKKQVDRSIQKKEQKMKEKEENLEEHEAKKRKRLGIQRINTTPDYVLSEELPSSLRQVTSCTKSPLEDYFTSLQKRNIIVKGSTRKPKSYGKVKYVRPSVRFENRDK